MVTKLEKELWKIVDSLELVLEPSAFDASGKERKIKEAIKSLKAIITQEKLKHNINF